MSALEERPRKREGAALLARHRAAASPLRGFPAPFPETLADAYAYQAAAITAWGQPVAGWKVGLISVDLAARFGDTRFIGPIFAETVTVVSDDTVTPFHLIPGGTALVEAELVARIEPSAPGQYTIQAWHIGIEVAGSPVAEIGTLGSLAAIAAFGNNIGLILGPEVAWDSEEPAACEVRIDDLVVGRDTTARLPGGPVAAVDFAIAKLSIPGAAPAGPLLISTGAITGMHPIETRQGFSASFAPGGVIRGAAMPLPSTRSR